MDRKAFYDALRPKLGAFTQANVIGFEAVLDEAQRRGTRLHDLAYILATAWWESGKTMAPVEEGYYLGKKARAFQRKLRYYPFYGRGLVQLTWEANYRKAGELYGLDLVTRPDLVLERDLSIRILFDGMENGWFTSKDLGDYIDGIDESDDEDLREFANARRIVNGVDRQVEIGKLALAFEAVLKAASYGETLSIPSAEKEPAMGASDLVFEKKPTPMQQSKKALGAGAGGGLGVALLQLAVGFGWLPPAFADPAVLMVANIIVGAFMSAVGAYVAPKNAD